MDVPQYIIDSASTSKAFPEGLSLTPEYTYLLHAAMGVAGEAGEMLQAINLQDRVNLGEEIGDAAFFLAMATRTLDVPLPDIDEIVRPGQPDPALEDVSAIDHFILWSSDFLDAIKKIVVYGKEPDFEDLQTQVKAGWGSLHHLSKTACFNLTRDILPANREKLAGKNGRYKDGYSDDAALHRNLVAEQDSLSKTLKLPRTAAPPLAQSQPAVKQCRL